MTAAAPREILSVDARRRLIVVVASDTRPKEEEAPRAKSLPLAPVARALPPELVPARMVNEVLYCERLMYLEWSQGEFTDNYFTVDGRFSHRRADEPGGALPPVTAPVEGAGAEPSGDGAADDVQVVEDGGPDRPPYKARSVSLSSESLGVTAKIDIVEGDDAGRVMPIEYKRGSPPEIPEGAYLPERAQLCVHVLLLREHGYTCDEAAIYYAAARQRVAIVIDDALVAATLDAIKRVRDLATAGTLPPPLIDSPKCNGCSLVGICLPDEVNLIRRLEGAELANDSIPPPPEPAPVYPAEEMAAGDADPWGFGTAQADDAPNEQQEPEAQPIRRLHAARDDKLPLYVQEQGARISLSGHRLVVAGRKTGKIEARLPNTSQVSLFGNVQISTQALRALLERGIPLLFFSSGGWYCGRATGLESKNIELRIAQHRVAADPARCLDLARGFVFSKVKNARTLLRRNSTTPDSVLLGELSVLARKATRAGSLAELLGLEGTAARAYFGAFTAMLKEGALGDGAFDWHGRNRRPPKDPLNALLSFAYALLVKEFTVVLGTVGLDPMLGFYHQPRFGRPALALDLMEEFRPLLADSVVLSAINTNVVSGDDFDRSPTAVALRPAARKRLTLAHERRMDQLVTHPLFGYRVSYRRVLELQARLLSRTLLGELRHYPMFRTR